MNITQFIASTAIAVSAISFAAGCDDRKAETDMRRTDVSNPNTPPVGSAPTDEARTASGQIPPTLDQADNSRSNSTTLQPPLTPPDGMVVPAIPPSTQPSTQPIGF